MNIDHEDVFDQYEMLRDAFGEQDYTNPEDFGDQDHTHKEPNFEASRFYINMHNLDAPIYPGNTKFTKLTFVMRLVHFKSKNNCSDTGFDELLSLIADVLPEEHTLPSKYRDIKKMVKKINLGYEKIHAYENDCNFKSKGTIAARKDFEALNIMPELWLNGSQHFKELHSLHENGALTSPEAKNIMGHYEKICADKNIDPATTSLELWVKAVGGVRKNKILESHQESPPAENLFVSNTNSEANPNSEASSEEPLRYKTLLEVCAYAERVDLNDEELLLVAANEPVNYKKASKDRLWRQAMEREIEAVEQNKTRSLCTLPPRQKAIDLKWIFKLKKDTDGNIVKHKVEIVAKGYVQCKGVDFEEIFAPVMRLETVRLLLPLAAKHSWEVHHLDVKTAFLNGEIKEEMYVFQPEGFVKEGEEHLVYRLHKALYGLRQAPRAWYSKLNRCLEELGFSKCPYEHAVYTKKFGGETLIIAVYVDDLLITGTNILVIERFKAQTSLKFDMSDLGLLSHYLGLEVKQHKGHIVIKQTAYARKILEKAGLSECNSTKYPMDPKEVITKDEMGKEVDVTFFNSLIGGLLYLVHIRPDIVYSVGIVSRFMERPTLMHLNAAKRVLRYVHGTLNFGLTHTNDSGNIILTGYTDSDLAGNLVDRKSTGGMAFYLNKSLITWVSQKQRSVALSSCEAEFIAATAAGCQAIWLKNLLSMITGERIGPVVLYIDNKSAIDLVKNPVFVCNVYVCIFSSMGSKKEEQLEMVASARTRDAAQAGILSTSKVRSYEF
ncbi:hypothetical protein AgCh_029627 [Apium graveolens]